MKKIILPVLVLIAFTSGNAQQLEWAKTTGGSSAHMYPQAIANDLSGNSSVVVGYFDGTIDLDPGAGDSTVTSAGLDDIFIQRFDDNGNMLWSYNIGGPESDQALGVEINDNGTIYITGKFGGTVDFDPLWGPYLKTSAGGSDIFVLTIDSSGIVQLAQTMGGTGNDYGTDIDQIQNGASVIIVGAFSGTADMDPGAPVLNITSNGGYDAFVTRFNTGFGVYSYGYGSTGTDVFNAVHSNYDGWISLTGSFEGTADFDCDAGDVLNLTSNGSSDIVMMNFHQAAPGSPNAWNFGSTGADAGFDVVTDSFTTTYITGYFSGTNVDFDASAGTAFNLSSIGGTDAFILAQDRYGVATYAKSIGGSIDDEANSICLTKAGTLYLGGSYKGAVDLDPGAGTYNVNGGAFGDGFIDHLDASGNLLWAGTVQGGTIDKCNGVARSATDELLACGTFWSVADFDPSPASDARSTLGLADMFVLKWSGCAPTGSAVSDSACFQYDFFGTNYYVSGTFYHTLTNAVGCDSIITLTLVINSVTTTVVQTGNALISNQPLAELASIQWIDCSNNQPVLGATNVLFVPAVTGSYMAAITSTNGCIDTTTCYTVTVTGMDNNLPSANISMFPNPTSGMITLTSEKNFENATLEVHDIFGKRISTRFIHHAASVEMEIAGAPGIYFVTLRNESVNYTMKVVKE